jgi:8-oxo-dGTP pyrophosphatase MutT (NUDIX family)
LLLSAAAVTLAGRLRAALALEPRDGLLAGDLVEGATDAGREAAVLVAVTDRPEPGVLLTVRREHMRTHAGQVSFPGGRLDPGEDAVAAALREAEEEIGLDRGFVELIGLSSPYRTGTNYLVTPVVGFVRPGFTLTPNPGEVADIFETPFGFLMDPGNYEQHEWESPEGLLRRFYATTHEDRYIWGATAGMLRALYERLYGAAVA